MDWSWTADEAGFRAASTITQGPVLEEALDDDDDDEEEDEKEESGGGEKGGGEGGTWWQWLEPKAWIGREFDLNGQQDPSIHWWWFLMMEMMKRWDVLGQPAYSWKVLPSLKIVDTDFTIYSLQGWGGIVMNLYMFLDLIASSSSYPCQSVSEWVSGYFHICLLALVSNCWTFVPSLQLQWWVWWSWSVRWPCCCVWLLW